MAKPRQNNDHVITETARRIRDLRQQRGLTRTQLADAAGLHEHALEKIEGDGTDMHITTLALPIPRLTMRGIVHQPSTRHDN